MVKPGLSGFIYLAIVLCFVGSAWAEQVGSVRGIVYDKDLDIPLGQAKVRIAETGQQTMTTDQGNYVLSDLKPGKYTLEFSKDGFARQFKRNVVVSPARMTEANVSLAGDFVDMEEFVVQDLKLGGGSEDNLLKLRMELPAQTDSIGSELMSQAGASTALDALKLVSGTTTQEGKYAVVRGLPDRYVNSQMNGVRLPSADPDKRAVQLDQFPAAIIESVQVTKTFMPDQQGDASGGAVNIILKGIPDKNLFKFNVGSAYDSQFAGSEKFMTHKGDGLNWLGMRDVDIPAGGSFGGPVGVCRGSEPIDYNWSMAAGGKHTFDSGIKVGGFGSLFYKRDSSFHDNGVEDSYWVTNPGASMTPKYSQGSPAMGDFKTSLFDVTRGNELVRWGGLGALGLESKNHKLAAVYLFTQVAEDTATLAEDTRGKAYYFPGYDRNDPNSPANRASYAAPYLRNETVKYTERTTKTLQFTGKHTLEMEETGIKDKFVFLSPKLDWTTAFSYSGLYQPDKKQFGEAWLPSYYDPGYPPYVPPEFTQPLHVLSKDAANFTLGNLQRVWRDISEESEQYFLNLKFPFRQWSGDEGYAKVGIFSDKVERTFNQDSFSNFNDNSANYVGEWEDFWSEVFPSENHPVSAADIDVDYEGIQNIFAWYYMLDVPVSSWLKFVGGVRYESTELEITLSPERDVTWIPPGQSTQVKLNPGDGDVSFVQDDVLPAVGFELKPFKQVTLRGSFSRTVARQTFKELTPIQQMEYLGADVFVGNPELQMSALDNYDLRLDYTPYKGGLLAVSWFHKDITSPIEYVQKISDFAYTTAVNYPKGKLTGIELEARQKLGHFWKPLKGLGVGANATFIDSEVTLPADEAAGFNRPNIMAPMKKRHMTNTPEYLYNLFLTYELKKYGTKLGLFYTVRGDTLVAGAGQSKGNYIPNVYETEYGTLNFSLIQKLDDHWKLKFQAKNLLNPKIQRVYRSDYIDGDTVKTSYRKGMEFGISLSAEF